MEVLVIGGTGNISREIVRALLHLGHEVVVVTRGRQPVPEGVRPVVVDRRDNIRFEAALRAESPDVVIDMIAYRREQSHLAVRPFIGRIQHFIHCSTVMTYGPPIERPFADETCALQARTDYGRNKIECDQFLLDQHLASGFPVTIVKPSYTYGEGNAIHRQVGDDGRWISRLRRGLPMLSAGDGDKLFHFLPTRDAGRFFALLAGRKATFGQVYNMVHPAPMTWDEWHRLVMRAVGREVDIVHAPSELLEAVDPKRYAGLDNNFGWQQTFSGAKAARHVPEWRPETDHLEWIARCLESMDRRGMITDDDQTGDALEDRIIEAMRNLPASLAGGEQAPTAQRRRRR